ncbi:MAG: methyl-accepting chemotaxis protein [Verrucomicrobia bacterium]|nr:methyl-accepting chemotaxis protein [Verrucomicrobiota bacterium]
MRRRSIRNKILLWAGLCMFGTLGIVVAYTSMTTRTIALDSAKQSVFSMAKENADEIAVVISGALDTARTLANALSTIRSARASMTRETVDSMLRTTLERNANFVGVYTAWEPNAFDGQDAKFVNGPGSDSTGRYIPYWCRNTESKIVVEPLVGYEDATRDQTGARKGDYYLLPRETKRECIIEPYIYPVQGKPTLMTSLVAPIMAGNTHYGLAGVDLSLDFLQSLVDKGDIFHKTGRILIVSHKGLVAAASGNPGIIGKPLKTAFGDASDEYLKIMQGAQEAANTVGGMVTAFAPIKLGQTDTPWSVIIQVPEREVVAKASAMMWRQIALGALFAAGVLLGLRAIASAIAKPISRAVQVAEWIAQGDIADAKQAIPAIEKDLAAMSRKTASQSSADAVLCHDESGQLLNAISTMTSNLASLLEQVQKSCAQLVSASVEIAATSNQQEATAGEFEVSTARVVTAVKEISATAQELARTMEGVKGTAEGAKQLADSGRMGMGNMEGTMKQLAEATTSITSKLSVISEKAGNINSVVTTITKVADQTNLLSLNAAIEAEKAGEYGLGFAVVAREIRRLADQTAVATLDIEAMVKEMQSSVTMGVMEMDKFNEEMKRGVRAVGEISGQLGQIIEKVKEVTGQFEKVNEGMKAQSQGAEQISEAMVHLSEGAKQTSESVKQSNAATEQLREAARSLQVEVARFKL